MKKIWHYIVLNITIPTHERRTTPPGSKSPIRVRRVCYMTQPINFRTYPWRTTILVTNRWNRSHLSWIFSKFLTFTLHTFVLTQIPNVEPSVFWSTEMTANPNQHWGGKNHTSVSRFVTRIAECLTIQWCQGNTSIHLHSPQRYKWLEKPES